MNEPSEGARLISQLLLRARIGFYRLVWRLSPLVGYRVRLRVLAGNALSSDEKKLSLTLGGVLVTISGQDRDKPLKEQKWLVFTARGFRQRRVAQAYGERLRDIVELSGLCVRNGVDVGSGKTSTFVNDDWAREIGLIKPHERTFPNVHGLQVVPDSDWVKFPHTSFTATVTSNPAQLTDSLQALDKSPVLQSSQLSNAVRLLNSAIAVQQPLARMTLAISAIEELGQDQDWSAQQRNSLHKMADDVVAGAIAGDLSGQERKEVGDAIRRGTHRLGLRQGVTRILRANGVSEAVKIWDEIYATRSGLVHGTSKLEEPDQARIANEAVTLCGRIVLTLLEREGVTLPAIAEIHYPRFTSGSSS